MAATLEALVKEPDLLNASLRQRQVSRITLVPTLLEGMIDVFNVLNANNVLAAGTLTASNLDRPTVVLTPRIARVGVKFDF